MGTWGPGPFDSDTAEDFLDELERQQAAQRLATVEHVFRSALSSAALQALNAKLPADGWSWSSWVDVADLQETQAAIDQMLSILGTVG